MANYSNLTAILSDLGEKNSRVTEAVLIKLGELTLAELEVSAHSETPASDRKEMTTAPWELDPGAASAIHSALRNHPNIFNQELLLKGDEMMFGDKFKFFANASTYRYRVHLPEALQIYKDDKYMDREEHFSVLCSGSRFAAYAPIKDIPTLSSIGHEFRELARKQIEKETPYKSPLLGPCPIHPDIIIVARVTEQPQDSAFKRYQHGDNILVLIDEKSSVADAVFDHFLDFRPSIDDFYRMLASRDDLIDLDTEVGTHFTAASENVGALARTPSWKVWETHRASREARMSLASVHEWLVTLERSLDDHVRNRNRSLENLKKRRTASPMYNYFKEMTDPEISLPLSAGPALNFFQNELQLYGNIRSLLLASLLGAIAGSLLTGLVGRFLLPAVTGK